MWRIKAHPIWKQYSDFDIIKRRMQRKKKKKFFINVSRMSRIIEL